MTTPACPTRPAASNPLRDIATMDAELLLNDLIAVERKLERLAEERKKGGGRDKAVDRARDRPVRDACTLSLPPRSLCAMLDLSLEEEQACSPALAS